jgi:Ca2+-transporting ATPase
MVFQTFVFMQGFNQINARSLGEKEWNCFSGIFTNWIFIAIVVVTFSVQIFFTQVFGRVMRTVPLTW